MGLKKGRVSNMSMATKIASQFREATLEQKHFIPDIKVTLKTHYGADHLYVTSDHAEAIAALTGKKTVTQKDILALKALGFQVHQQQERKVL
jgi:histone H3/H4